VSLRPRAQKIIFYQIHRRAFLLQRVFRYSTITSASCFCPWIRLAAWPALKPPLRPCAARAVLRAPRPKC